VHTIVSISQQFLLLENPNFEIRNPLSGRRKTISNFKKPITGIAGHRPNHYKDQAFKVF
jgi:hypothetical protein